MVSSVAISVNTMTNANVWKVCVLFVCDTLNSAFDVALVYIPFVVHWGTSIVTHERMSGD